MTSNQPNSLSGINVEKTEDDRYRISWNAIEGDARVQLFAGKSPATIDRKKPVAEISDANTIVVSLPEDITFPYFTIAVKGQPGVVWAERRLPLEKTYNFRDIGGYRTIDNRRMRWGGVYRSAHLAELTDVDHDLLEQIGIKLVCDFRTIEEAENQPDRLPPDGSMEHRHMPIAHGKFDPAEAIGRIRKGDISWLTDDFMTNNYLKQIDDFAGLWKQFFEFLMDRKNRPLVFHCTAGKDRTGVCAALILLAAGVPESTVIADHALSNSYNAPVIRRIQHEIRKFGIDPDDMRSYLSAPREAMVAVVSHLRKDYGSAKDYLVDKAGIDRQDLEELIQEITTAG
jgi:protein-tyrosine phosphatase